VSENSVKSYDDNNENAAQFNGRRDEMKSSMSCAFSLILFDARDSSRFSLKGIFMITLMSERDRKKRRQRNGNGREEGINNCASCYEISDIISRYSQVPGMEGVLTLLERCQVDLRRF
jgi:hypothetical protein